MRGPFVLRVGVLVEIFRRGPRDITLQQTNSGRDIAGGFCPLVAVDNKSRMSVWKRQFPSLRDMDKSFCWKRIQLSN